MSELFDYSGDGNFFPGGSIYPNPKVSSPFLSLGHHVGVYFPISKRSRISSPFEFSRDIFEEQQPASIEVLPDECLFEVFRRLPGGEERSICACVSKRWLTLLSSIGRDELRSTQKASSLKTERELISDKADGSFESDKKGGIVDSNCDEEPVAEDQDTEGDGYLSRCLEGKKATDVRLAAIAVGTGHRGGLGKLSIRGSNSAHGVTDLGLKSIARCCPSLRILSLWNISTIGDEGLSEISSGCRLLEKLNLCRCPAISDKALLAIAKNCPNLTSITIDSCSNIGNGSLQAIGNCCCSLRSVSIKNCPLVGDQGIAGLLSSAGYSLTNLKLQALNISDVSVAVIGHYGKALTDLVLGGLQNVSERGFWVMGNCQGLQKLRSLSITSCQGITDLGLEIIGKSCPNLKQLYLLKCAFLSDHGLVSFAKVAVSLQNLHFEECHRVTQAGLFGILVNSSGKLKSLTVANCLGLRDLVFPFPSVAQCSSLQSLSIQNCPGFGNVSLAMLGVLCPQLQNVGLNGLNGITDEGLLPLIKNCEAGLSKVNLSNCGNLTDKVVSVIARLHGLTLEQMNLDGCKKVTDASMVAIAENCLLLSELDVSKCAITDSGISALASAVQFNLQILSLSGCPFISDKSLPHLVELGQMLVGLNVQHCSAISNNTVDLLLEQLWQCDILY